MITASCCGLKVFMVNYPKNFGKQISIGLGLVLVKERKSMKGLNQSKGLHTPTTIGH